MNSKNNVTEPYRVIKTARDITAINKAVDSGFFPLVKMIKPLDKLFRTRGVFRNKKTNKFEESHAYSWSSRDKFFSYEDEDEWELVVPFYKYYPYKYEKHYAAYLIPPDIAIGEIVVLEDLIEDYYGGSFWDRPIRLDSLKATWTGDDLSILYDPNVDGICNM